MSFRINPAIQQLFGSETRAKVLGLLADSSEPKTGYELSKRLGINPSKVYETLRKMEGAGFLGVVPDFSPYKRYLLVDEDLKRLLLKSVRIVAEEDWFSPERVREREEAAKLTKRIRVDIPASSRNRKDLPIFSELIRPPEKDRALRRIATRTPGFGRKRKRK